MVFVTKQSSLTSPDSAFMGNRCFRYGTRHFTDWITTVAAFPISGAVIAPYLDQKSRPVILCMGFLRAVLPFASSFQGSRLGRQLTFNTYKFANYRWRPVMSIWHFHELAGVYQDTEMDPELLALARAAAGAIGHGKDPSETRKNLALIGFNVFGSGIGGYAVYRMQQGDKLISMHVTPYGPSINDELPMFVLLERRRALHRTADPPDATILDAASKRETKVCGFTFSGAFFQSQEWAALKTRYDRELENYSNACRIMGTDLRHERYTQDTKSAAPPLDLVSLKAFLRTGRPPYKQRRDDKKWKGLQKQVKNMSNLVAKYQLKEKAPKRVILYLEGLDCAGKSSTGMLICHSLQQCGYSVDIAQHNRPPTPEQSQKPWMDRGRFEYPDDICEQGSKVPEYASLVWDRGPVGDFVYGKLNELPQDEKLNRYQQFREYDYNCSKEGVLFCKIFYCADKDSIAKTLGKRLAHKKIARDLHAWLDANNTVEESREGLREIEMHIDPTDFVAFNNYEENLTKFAEVVRNTDSRGPVSSGPNATSCRNPWLVVNTSDRHAARINILKGFQRQLKRFASHPDDRMSAFDRVVAFLGREIVDYPIDAPVPSDIVERREHGISLRAILQSILLALLLYAYVHQTYYFDIGDII
jgi:polyphosphate kinase 2 (PPK2 family)